MEENCPPLLRSEVTPYYSMLEVVCPDYSNFVDDCRHVLSRVPFLANDLQMYRHRQSLLFKTSIIRLSPQRSRSPPPAAAQVKNLWNVNHKARNVLPKDISLPSANPSSVNTLTTARNPETKLRNLNLIYHHIKQYFLTPKRLPLLHQNHKNFG